MTKKSFISFISIILACAIFLACAIGSSWFTNGNFKTWFNSWGKGSTAENSEQWNGLIATPDKDNNDAMKMSVTRTSLGEDAQAEEGYTLTVTLNEDATYKDVTWSFAWETECADDISQYFEVTANGLTATAKSLQPFATPIIVTATSDFDTALSVSCKFDYLKELLSVTFSVNGPLVLEGETPYSIACEYGVGTIQGEFQLNDFLIGTLEESKVLKEKVKNSPYYNAAKSLDGKIRYNSSFGTQQFTETVILASYSDFFYYYPDSDLSEVELSEEIISNLKAAFAGAINVSTLGVCARGSYLYGEYSKFVYSDFISTAIDASNLATPVTDINMNTDHIVVYPY